MAPSRRRVSRRVVKSTFQECFEYDIPGFRGVESKRSSVISPRNRLNTSGHKIKPKQEDIKKIVTRNCSHPAQENNSIDKEKSRKEVPKTKEYQTIKKIQSGNKVKSPLVNRSKVKLFMGTDYNVFKSSLSKNKASPDVLKIKVPVSNISSTTPDLIFDSKNWQPVVHLEKICVTASGRPKSCIENNKTPIKQDQKLQISTSSRSLDLATRLKNVLRNPIAEKELGLSNKVSNSMLVDHILQEASVENSNCGSPKKILERKSIDSFGDVNRGRSMNITRVEHLLPERLDTKQPGSDSAIEDWPDSASGESDDEENKTYSTSLFSPSEISDWSSPQVSLILQWQKHFNSVAEELMSSFDSLKNVIEEKNSVISALTNKLNNYDESPCHKILDNILLDYDKHNPQNPATKIINSILQYPNLKP